MALRTNTKQVKEKIKNYITDGFHDSDFESWNEIKINDYNTICEVILSTFYAEKVHHDSYFKAGRCSIQDLFFDWCAGLPNILDTDYYYSVNAVDLVGDILEQTETEKAKYTEDQAEKCMTYLLWRELNAHGTINKDYDAMINGLKR